jgi:transposase
MEKAPPTKRPRYDAAFRAEALLLASESRSTLAATRALNIDPKRFYTWQKAAQQPCPPTILATTIIIVVIPASAI